LEAIRINREFNNLLSIAQVANIQGGTKQLAWVESGVIQNIGVYEDCLVDVHDTISLGLLFL